MGGGRRDETTHRDRSLEHLESTRDHDNIVVNELCKGTSCIKKNEYPTQCDQMVKSLFNIWPFVTMKISPIMSQNLPKKSQHFAK